MAQYGNIGQAILKRKALATYRQPTFACFLEGEGDVTSYLKTFDVNTSVEDSLKEPNYGHGTVVLTNVGGIFSSKGVPTIEPNRWIYLYAGFDGDNIPIWTGVVTDPTINAELSEITLQVAQPGILLRRSKKEGNISSYNTPKLLIDYLCYNAGLPTPVFENASGVPTTFTFGNTWIENPRDYWALVHGACLCIFYVPYFDERGVLQLKRRSSYTDVDFVYTDNIIKSLYYLDDAELINVKHLDFATSVKFEAQFSDKIHPYQHIFNKTDTESRNRWGEFADAETDDLIGSFQNAKKIVTELMDWYPWKRVTYAINCPGIPYLQLFDRVQIKSTYHDIHGYFTIMGRNYSGTAGRFTTTDTLISSGTRF